MRNRELCWLLIGAVALGASLAGHSVQSAIESSRLFGSVQASYAHSLQTPIAYLVFGALVIAALFIARGVLEGVRDELDGGDWLVPVLDAISRIDPGRLVALVIGMQFAFLIIGELTEQTLSSYSTVGLGAIFGPGHFTAAFVHVAIGTLAALLLFAFSRAVCARARDLARFTSSIIAWMRRPNRVGYASVLRMLAHGSKTPAPPLLARHIASRPPPVSVALVA